MEWQHFSSCPFLDFWADGRPPWCLEPQKEMAEAKQPNVKQIEIRALTNGDPLVLGDVDRCIFEAAFGRFSLDLQGRQIVLLTDRENRSLHSWFPTPATSGFAECGCARRQG